ncbi:hypothetical protein [Atlantibacter sp.]|uniref:hypothetical protein n=1 Tax=Atlantibacter sp. TaxID=1903473 RepID=UPI0028A16523|nr:hypothetical protein [Atlantibacter sp.]
MKCPSVINKPLLGVVTALLLTGAPQAFGTITHTQLESYDFVTREGEIINVKNEHKDVGVMRFISASPDKAEQVLTDEYRICLNSAGTQGYLRILGTAPVKEVAAPQVPMVRFAHEQDLHVLLLGLPKDRRLIYFVDTADLWVVDKGAALKSSPDCKR